MALNIYDPQSDDIIRVIRFNGLINSHISIDQGKVLVANRNSGDIWDTTMNPLTHVGSIQYNGEQATFSPDGTRVASIYGKLLKIWKTDAGYNHPEASTHVHDTIDDVYISPDEQLVILKSQMGADILDATTSQSLFTYPVANFQSIGFSRDLALVAFLLPPSEVQIWNTHTHLHKSIAVGNNITVSHIALSPDGSQLASLSSFHMKLWDLDSEGCLAHLEFDSPLEVQVQISFSTNATSISLLKNSGSTRSWLISPNQNIDPTQHSIKNSDGTKGWLVSHPLMYPWHFSPWHISLKMNREGTKLPMVFVPTMEEQSDRDASAPRQLYHCDMDNEWILDQDKRRVLWIPPDERPRKIWNCFEHEKKVLVQSGKVYIVNFS
jgi:hypothetical protein